MGTPVVTQQPTVANKIDQAAVEAAKIAEIFAPNLAPLIEAGVAVEPILRGFVQMIANLFHHHAKSAVPSK